MYNTKSSSLSSLSRFNEADVGESRSATRVPELIRLQRWVIRWEAFEIMRCGVMRFKQEALNQNKSTIKFISRVA